MTESPDNRAIAEKRLVGSKHKMTRSKDPVIYHVWYILHHGMYYLKQKKILVVFDCGSEYQGLNLNSLLLQKPDLTNTLLEVYYKFRKENITITWHMGRVALLKVITIQRLELCAAVLSMKYSVFLQRELELQNMEEIFKSGNARSKPSVMC